MRSRLVTLVFLSFVVAGACGGEHVLDDLPDAQADADSAEGDSSDDGGSDGGSDAGDAGGEAGATPVPGPLTMVMDSMVILPERLCDLDGDGDRDNGIADLGEPFATVISSTFNTVLANRLGDAFRQVVHFPMVDDLTGPTTSGSVGIIFRGEDTDRPVAPDDDFSGNEPFYAAVTYLDACGEPRIFSRGVDIDSGTLVMEGLDLTVPFGDQLEGDLVMRNTRFEGTVEPFAQSAELTSCGALVVGDVGALPGFVLGDEGVTLLEEFLQGGAVMGLEGLPGLDPDVDIDGDGLERYELGDDGLLQRCIDGDSTVLEGRDCWRDDRMADGFSFTFRITAVGASFAGREPNWEVLVTGTCDSPPETSVFDPP